VAAENTSPILSSFNARSSGVVVANIDSPPINIQGKRCLSNKTAPLPITTSSVTIEANGGEPGTTGCPSKHAVPAATAVE
jgi:hypothetical protein